ncbi:hypothetical protein IEN85_06355 [Pelagicoccus sp. NFK12]|uniref:Uncharacterized protein n=1 Tax=Pelagicoccus enzymogenes TaxID=2773457 RepID=A0A927F633_9BACT|nr:hypothetical protein [Pelagicoccus enzymogenes]MBD5779108.1 hypothetical protein [Pelagicoccus enzymogenes]MDQ8200170.1 hypothetical protein [Pelagicoccus enzymogenes]
MKNISKILSIFVATACLIPATNLELSAKDTDLHGLTPKEFKMHKREARSYGFETRITKDKANDLILVESPIEEDPIRETQRYYLRAAVRDKKVLVTQIIVTKTHLSFTEYDSATMDYSKATVDGLPLYVEIAPPNPNPGQDAITQMSTVQISLAQLKKYEYTGMELKVFNKIGETDIKIKGSLIHGFLNKLDSQTK